MSYTEEMTLASNSGYCMPFEERKGDVHLCLGYGKQTHPDSKEEFFHHGLDFFTDHYILAAVADGVVTGVNTDTVHGLQQTILYGKYAVTYGHLENIFKSFGQKVQSGTAVSTSGNILHLEVTFDGKEINPLDFLTMLYGNVKMFREQGHTGMPDMETFDMDIPTEFDDERKEIEELMIRYYPSYFKALYNGEYLLPTEVEQSLRNVFSLSASRNYFYEVLPSLSNPLGVGERAAPIVAKVQNILIADFLSFLALRHQVFLSTLSDSDKKKVLKKPNLRKRLLTLLLNWK